MSLNERIILFIELKTFDIPGKGEIACFEQFPLLSQCFRRLLQRRQKASICGKVSMKRQQNWFIIIYESVNGNRYHLAIVNSEGSDQLGVSAVNLHNSAEASQFLCRQCRSGLEDRANLGLQFAKTRFYLFTLTGPCVFHYDSSE